MGNNQLNLNDLNFDKSKKPDISIQYCGGWGYGKNANNLKDEINKAYPNSNVNLIKDNGVTGNFEVKVNNKLIHSKKNGEGFPQAGKFENVLKETVEN